MGQGADDALERAAEECDHFERFRDSSPAIQYEEGLTDESGSIIGRPNSYPGRRTPPKGLWDM